MKWLSLSSNYSKNRRRIFGGEARNASPASGNSAAAGARGGGRARGNASDQSDEPPRKKDKDVAKLGRAKEAGRLAADAMIRVRDGVSALRRASRGVGSNVARPSKNCHRLLLAPLPHTHDILSACNAS